MRRSQSSKKLKVPRLAGGFVRRFLSPDTLAGRAFLAHACGRARAAPKPSRRSLIGNLGTAPLPGLILWVRMLAGGLFEGFPVDQWALGPCLPRPSLRAGSSW